MLARSIDNASGKIAKAITAGAVTIGEAILAHGEITKLDPEKWGEPYDRAMAKLHNR